jgi:hypothetical protein
MILSPVAYGRGLETIHVGSHTALVTSSAGSADPLGVPEYTESFDVFFITGAAG